MHSQSYRIGGGAKPNRVEALLQNLIRSTSSSEISYFVRS